MLSEKLHGHKQRNLQITSFSAQIQLLRKAINLHDCYNSVKKLSRYKNLLSILCNNKYPVVQDHNSLSIKLVCLMLVN